VNNSLVSIWVNGKVIKTKKEKAMKSKRRSKMAMLITVLALLLVPGVALAVGTSASNVVVNNAQLDFTVSGVGQPSIVNTTDFTVDRKVNFTVTTIASSGVSPGLVNATLIFDVANLANDDLGYMLSVYADPANAITMQNVEIYIDDGNGTWDGVGTETLYTPGNFAFNVLENAAAQRVYIVADTPGTAVDGNVDNYYLIANATEPGTNTLITNTAGANGEDTLETVLADGIGGLDGAGAADVNYNNIYSSMGTYTVSSAIISFSKVVGSVVWDPVNFNNGNQKAIPGAYVEYVVTVDNGAGASSSAVLTTITDTLPASLALIQYMDTNLNTATPSSTIANEVVVTNCVVPSEVRACETVPQGFAGAGPNLSLNMATLLPAEGALGAGELAPGDTVEIRYMVQIQ